MRRDLDISKQFLTTVGPPLLLTAVLFTLQHNSVGIIPGNAGSIFIRAAEEAQCPIDLHSNNACSQVPDACADFEDGLIPYLRLYACAPQAARPILLVVMVIWLPVLFASMAITAAEYLAVHLEYIVPKIGISENLAGVTIFAFGNGCTDLFATLAAMGANSGSLAISELFGAAAFITTVVLGCIAFVHPFSVDPKAFIGDIVWFIVAAAILIAFLADGQLLIGECLGILGLYVAFALFAIFRPRSRDQEEILLSQSTSGPFRDDTGNDDGVGMNDGAMLPIPNMNASIDNGNDNANESETLLSDQQRDEYESADNNGNAQEVEDPVIVAEALPPGSIESNAAAARVRNGFLGMVPLLATWHQQSVAAKVLTTLSLPLLIPIGLTVSPCLSTDYCHRETGPVITQVRDLDTHTNRMRRTTSVMSKLWQWEPPRTQHLADNWTTCLQLILGPQLFSIVVATQGLGSTQGSSLLLGSLVACLTSTLLITYVFSNGCIPATAPGGSLLTSVLAFSVSLIWIYLTATSAVTSLMTLAWIWNIPTALLGATVFAVGQSSNDLVANTAVARRGMPVLAASATFGGPMLNMFLGIGGGGLIQALKSKNSGGSGIYTFRASTGLFVSAANLLLGLGITLVYVFCNSWRVDRRLGLILIGVWVVFTLANVGLSVST